MAATRKFDLTAVRKAIQRVGASPAKIAADLGCSRSTIYRYLKQYPELNAAYETAGGEVDDRPQFSLETFKKAIPKSGGNKVLIAKRVGCSRQTVVNALERWSAELDPLMAQADEAVVDIAESRLMKQLKADNLRAIIFTLETKGKDRGWSKRTEITGADGEPLFSAETVEMLRALGQEPGAAARMFEQMVRAKYMAEFGPGARGRE